MGSPLGVTFADVYMCHLENNILLDPALKPSTYCRYVDDIFVEVRSEAHLKDLQQSMERASVLRFTYEINIQNKIPFLDVFIDSNDGQYTTSVFRKKTNLGKCLNALSECPQRYKLSVIRAYLRRAHRNCSSWELFHQELSRVKQILINNGYSNTDVDKETRLFITRTLLQHTQNDTHTTHTVFYKNQMTPAYKTDERVLHDIISRNVTCTNPQNKLLLIIYYKNPRVLNLIMKNNLSQDPSFLKKTNVVYQYTCPEEGCKLLPNSSYIGVTTTSISRRLTMHAREGSIRKHMTQAHNRPPTRQDLVENTKILKHCSNHKKLHIFEKVYISQHTPLINIQTDTLGTLQLHHEPTSQRRHFSQLGAPGAHPPEHHPLRPRRASSASLISTVSSPPDQ